MYKSFLIAIFLLVTPLLVADSNAQVENPLLGDDGELYQAAMNNTSPNLLSVIIYKKSGDYWSAEKKYFYSYNQDDSLVEIITQKFIQSSWTDIYRITYTYDPTGKHIDKLTEINNSTGGWTNTGKLIFTYSTNREPTEINQFSWINSAWKKFGTDFYQRNSLGNPTELIRMFELIGVWEFTDRYTYFYDMHNQLTLTVGDFWTGSWSTLERTANRYNSSGDIVETLRENWRQGDWHFASRDSVSYNSLGRKDYLLSQNFFSENWVNSRNHTYLYNDNGNLERDIKQKYSNDQWFDETMRIYSWDVISSVDNEEDPPLPISFQLEQNYPNPFNPSTNISFSIDQRSQITLAIFNLLGQKVTTLIDSQMEAGNHSVEWDGTDASGTPLASGLFFYRLTVEDNTVTRKMLLIK